MKSAVRSMIDRRLEDKNNLHLKQLVSEFICLLRQIGLLMMGADHRHIVIMVNGKPFAGKGRFIRFMSGLLNDQSGIEVSGFSTSAEIKTILDARSDGDELRRLQALGHLMPDDLAIEALFRALDRFSREQFRPGQVRVVDGFPRTGAQAADLWNLIDQKIFFPNSLIISVVLHASDEVVWRRWKDASVVGDREGRDDDNPESLKTRLEIFHANALCYLGLRDQVLLSLDLPTDVNGENIPTPEIVRSMFGLAIPALQSEKERLQAI